MVKIEPINSDQELKDYFNSINSQIEKEWEHSLSVMKFNVDLTICTEGKPFFDGSITSRNKKLRLVMINNRNLIDSVTKSKNKYNALLQIFYKHNSIILAINYRPDAHLDWADKSYNITEPERLLISMMLDASEGVNNFPFYFIKDLVYSYAEKYKSSNIVRILD